MNIVSIRLWLCQYAPSGTLVELARITQAPKVSRPHCTCHVPKRLNIDDYCSAICSYHVHQPPISVDFEWWDIRARLSPFCHLFQNFSLIHLCSYHPWIILCNLSFHQPHRKDRKKWSSGCNFIVNDNKILGACSRQCSNTVAVKLFKLLWKINRQFF